MAKKNDSSAFILVVAGGLAVAGYLYKDKILAALGKSPSAGPAPAPVDGGENGGGGFGVKPPGLPYEPMIVADPSAGGVYAGGSGEFDETAGSQAIDSGFGVKIGGGLPVLKSALDAGAAGPGTDLLRRWL